MSDETNVTDSATATSRRQVADALLGYGERLRAEQTTGIVQSLADDPAADALLKSDGFAFLLAVVADGQVTAERAWTLPHLLKQRLGHLSVTVLADTNPLDLAEVIRQKPALHRFPPTIALWIVSAARRLRRLGIEADELWSHAATAKEIAAAFEAFDGISQKKSSMATNILVRDRGVVVPDMHNMDVSYDVMVRRVFLRSGLVDSDTLSEVLDVARALNPEYPGALDLPAWYIGRRWCRPSSPDCPSCPIGSACARRTTLDATFV